MWPVVPARAVGSEIGRGHVRREGQVIFGGEDGVVITQRKVLRQFKAQGAAFPLREEVPAELRTAFDRCLCPHELLVVDFDDGQGATGVGLDADREAKAEFDLPVLRLLGDDVRHQFGLVVGEFLADDCAHRGSAGEDFKADQVYGDIVRERGEQAGRGRRLGCTGVAVGLPAEDGFLSKISTDGTAVEGKFAEFLRGGLVDLREFQHGFGDPLGNGVVGVSDSGVGFGAGEGEGSACRGSVARSELRLGADAVAVADLHAQAEVTNGEFFLVRPEAVAEKSDEIGPFPRPAHFRVAVHGFRKVVELEGHGGEILCPVFGLAGRAECRRGSGHASSSSASSRRAGL